MRLIFADIETTGFSREWDSIIEIAAIAVDEDLNEINRFHEYIYPGKSIPAKITEITGITNEMVEGKRNEKDVMMDFLVWVLDQEADRIVGHNYDAFDGQFFNTKAIKYGLTPLSLETIDTLKIAREKKIPTNMKTARGAHSYRQEALADYYGIEYQAHSAIEDVRALIKIYKEMTSEAQNISEARKSLGF